MEKTRALHFVAAFCLFLNLSIKTDAVRKNSACFSSTLKDTCGYDYFRCLDGTCIERNKYCNGYHNCPDESDERYCNYHSSCPESGTSHRFWRCRNSQKCIPYDWVCDGNADCPSSYDERDCIEIYRPEGVNVDRARTSAVRWMKKQIQAAAPTEKWGSNVHKLAVALYLADPDFISKNDTRKEMAYELTIQLLSRLALKQLENVSSVDMASFINAFLVTCLNPRDFYGINLVQELRTRVDNSNHTSPYLLLTLCNAGDTITESDLKKLVDTFWSNHREFWTEIQALAVMTIVCAGEQSENGVDSEMLNEFTMELKQHQYRNGTVENIQTTALVLQALYSSEPDEDPDNFDDVKALQQILSHQQKDGSFGNFMKTYYVLPILGCRSLVNISFSHCETISRDENSALQYLVNQNSSKTTIQYSLWIGNQRDMERTLTLRVPSNISFYGIMEIAAEIDFRFKFEYTVKNRKPYINAVSGILDDAEGEKFWFPYLFQDGEPVLIEKNAVRVNSECSLQIRKDSCGYDYFRCIDGTCIERRQYCNGRRDCPDESDEDYCKNYSSCPESKTNPFSRCPNSRKCIPNDWFCDGNVDCPDSYDEKDCNEIPRTINVNRARNLAIKWIKTQIEESSSTEKWGTLVHKTAVALYLADPEFSSGHDTTRKEMAYELSIQLLSRLALKQLENVSSVDMASFIHALLVTCLNPRDFYGINLVQELRTRTDSSNYTSPYLLLALCNAGDTITESDIKKLAETFWNNHREFWTEIQALSVMALMCAGEQSENSVDFEMLKDFTMELKQHQYRNGTIENLQTTALVLQALYSVEPESDLDNFDEMKALQQILSHQQTDGSFGNFLKTYYILPILNCKSLVNISSSHCETISRDENSALQYMVNLPGSKMKIHYSIWIGSQRDMERTLTLRVPNNTSFYGIMEIAAEIDVRYKFEYTVKNNKPYINAVSGILDDAEGEKFWFPYLLQGGKPVLIEKSSADVIPKENEHLVMWYRSGSWSG